MDINLIAPINQLGYGIASVNILKTLQLHANNVSLFPIGPLETSAIDAHVVNLAKKQSIFYNCKAPSLRIWHAKDLAMHVGSGPRIGFPIFELDKFTSEEIHQMDCMDKIFVCSKWAQTIVNDSTVTTKAYVVPLGVDNKIFNITIANGKLHHSTNFFNCGKWEIRKGHDILWKAFNLAFEKDDDVCLTMHCYNPFLNEEANNSWANVYLRSKLGREGKIRISKSRLANQNELARMMAAMDCGVFPSRAEGWNLEALEMLSMGKQVILTNYSAHTEYGSSACLLIEISKTEPAHDKIWFNGEGNWAMFADSQLEQLITYMRSVHKLKQEGLLGTNHKGIEVAGQFTWDNTVEYITREI